MDAKELKRQAELLGLPSGFYFTQEPDDYLVCLRYNGPGYMQVVQCGGEKPKPGSSSAFLGFYNQNMFFGTKLAELIQVCVKKTLAEAQG